MNVAFQTGIICRHFRGRELPVWLQGAQLPRKDEAALLFPVSLLLCGSHCTNDTGSPLPSASLSSVEGGGAPRVKLFRNCSLDQALFDTASGVCCLGSAVHSRVCIAVPNCNQHHPCPALAALPHPGEPVPQRAPRTASQESQDETQTQWLLGQTMRNERGRNAELLLSHHFKNKFSTINSKYISVLFKHLLEGKSGSKGKQALLWVPVSLGEEPEPPPRLC